MEIQLNIQEKMLLELLRAALTQQQVSDDLFDAADEASWKSCYNLARKHGVMALAWDGVLALPQQYLPPRQLKLTWALQVEKYEERYKLFVRTLVELCHFYAEHGIGVVLLKGVGLSAYYPVPEHREGGDLDIYTYSLNRDVMSDEEANQKANQLMIDRGIKVEMEDLKHCVFMFKGITVENHRQFVDEYNLSYAKSLNGYLKQIIRPCEVRLLKGEARIFVPSPEFNALFVPFHAMHHWCDGLCLHHLCDWAVTMQQCGTAVLTDERLDPHFRKVLQVFTEFTNRYLGTHAELGDYSLPLYELLVEGLFRPKYEQRLGSSSKWEVFIYKLKSYFYRMGVRRRVLGQSVGLTLLNTVFVHVKYPHKIFKFH